MSREALVYLKRCLFVQGDQRNGLSLMLVRPSDRVVGMVVAAPQEPPKSLRVVVLHRLT
jgi:hypothetical protein